jgi:diacylglycerol kinase (ATP)
MRIIKAFIYSLQGLRTAISKHVAFKQELLLFFVLSAYLLFAHLPYINKIILFICVTILLITELLNSAIETAIDRVSLERHPLSKEVKDLASAAVLVSIGLNLVVWPLLIFNIH